MTILKPLLNDWNFKAAGENEWLPAAVPGCVHRDLVRNGVISDPFFGTNEYDLQWIDKKDWEYETYFDVSPELLKSDRVELVFEGLDTYAEITLNGRPLLRTNNMFRTWRADGKPLLQPAENHLHLLFRSPVHEGLAILETKPYGLPAINDHSEDGGLGERKVSVYARKAPYHYGWDWGPRFVTSGIWRELYLEAWSDARMADLFIRQDGVTADQARLTALVEVETSRGWEGELVLSSDRGHSWTRPVSLTPGHHRIELEVEIERPDLWWCRGLGAPALYSFTAELKHSEGSTAVRTVRTGLRSVRLVREPDDSGTSFYIELNGIPVFAKGANHIPNDSFVTEVTAERYRHEIATAAESHMNMLRVWGGGIYEQDVFYDLCDEYGLLVWQDYMFACSMYPGDPAFIENVRAEAQDNLVRLRNHPCLALWCGNNEIDAAWSHYLEDAGWGWKEQYPADARREIWQDYLELFHKVLPEVTEAYAPGASYWPSSPMAGLSEDGTRHSGYTSQSGDIHYWGVWHAEEPFENYNVYVGRFMSEYGFQSFPELRTVLSYALEHDLELTSDVMLAHQKNNRGNLLIQSYMRQAMNEPNDFRSFLHMSQLLQADAMRMAIEAHRRRRPLCMGTLYWQMNDCWPVASWAGMDYFGRWKAMQYAVREAYQDLTLSMDNRPEDSVAVYVLSDRPYAIQASLRLRVYDRSGQLRSEPYRESISVEAGSSLLAVNLPVDSLLQDAAPEDRLLLVELEEDGVLTARRVHYFVSARQLPLSRPAIRIKELPEPDGPVYVLETNVLASRVWLLSEKEGCFSRNDFELIPGQPERILFYARASDPENPAFVRSSAGRLNVTSLFDLCKSPPTPSIDQPQEVRHG
ncbi:glycoside hydrolase family 2 protein [Paenibacillus aurantius]|uniref:Beta-mannosidase B n=1 Tax=Paenibacillus aurantius TaxID=2918900 RepID=A0AA96LH41_9BACL|nr:glycoside hydrolase family 2 protein [Paenibacillus aurantius]WNQ13170.1 glycoside hydrolase family 2 protein [Paenibacillus aurantius]